jgi:thiol:disulfide interchange protein
VTTSAEAAKPEHSSTANGLPFIEDDYARALAEARRTKRPLFVDAWAPWCHTCRYMRAFVFSDPALAPEAARFVFLSVDTEKPGGADFEARYPLEVWPTLFVIDPDTERAVLRWPGSANASELHRILDDGVAALEAARAGEGPDATGGDKATARKEYEKSIELNPKFDGAKKALKAL